MVAAGPMTIGLSFGSVRVGATPPLLPAGRPFCPMPMAPRGRRGVGSLSTVTVYETSHPGGGLSHSPSAPGMSPGSVESCLPRLRRRPVFGRVFRPPGFLRLRHFFRGFLEVPVPLSLGFLFRPTFSPSSFGSASVPSPVFGFFVRSTFSASSLPLLVLPSFSDFGPLEVSASRAFARSSFAFRLSAFRFRRSSASFSACRRGRRGVW